MDMKTQNRNIVAAGKTAGMVSRKALFANSDTLSRELMPLDAGGFDRIYSFAEQVDSGKASPKDLIMEFSQALRDQDIDLLFSFAGALGDFVVLEFDATEKINAPFEVNMRLAADDPSIDLHELMDTVGVFGIFDKYQEPRFIHGLITDIERGDQGQHRTQYQLTLRPTLWRLSQCSDCRIWQQKSIPEIVSKVLEESAVHDVEWRLADTYLPREYLTQLSENNLDFITRITSEEGIFYYFEHGQNKHKLIFSDAPLSSPKLEHAPEIRYLSLQGGSDRSEAVIRRFSQVERLRSSAYEINDYTFKNPNSRMREKRTAQEVNGVMNEYALYEFPGRYKDPSNVGKKFVKNRIESVRVEATTGKGLSNVVHLSPGYHFTLQDHPDDRANVAQLLLGVAHKGTQAAALEEEADPNVPSEYAADFTTMPARLPYRPPTPKKPTVEGPQIAIVTGPEGEEIYCDEYGRVKVWFPWDRHGEKNENSSCWIRVSQAWAGSGYGGVMIPRIGQEVIVAYLDGDIDQPIVIGRTFHAVNRAPTCLPQDKTKMCIRSQTHKGEGYNELSFEDEAGQEKMKMYAQRDQVVQVNHNQSVVVGGDQKANVTGCKDDDIGGDFKTHVTGYYDLNIDGYSNIRVGGVASMWYQSGVNYYIDGPSFLYAVGSLESTYTEEIYYQTDSNMHLIAKAHMSITAVKNDASFKAVAGRTDIEGQTGVKLLSEGGDIELEAKNNITLKCGAASIALSRDGKIMINGTDLNSTISGPVTIMGTTIDLN